MSSKTPLPLRDWFRRDTSSTGSSGQRQQQEDIEVYKYLLLDGGVSTHLRELYGREYEHDELWSSSLLLTAEGRDTIVQGHKDWLSAGSNILTTVTYQCHTLTKDVKVNDEQLAVMLKNGVALAERSVQEWADQAAKEGGDDGVQRPHYVVASIGCYGAALSDGNEYTGNYPNIQSEQDLIGFHKQRLHVLLAQRPDGIALETVPCVLECRAFCSLLAEIHAQQQQSTTLSLPACWISLACRNDRELNDGSHIEQALDAILELDPKADLVQAIGINCCDSQYIAALAKRVARHFAQTVQQQQQDYSLASTDSEPLLQPVVRGIVLYPNSGEEWNATTKAWKEGTGLRVDDMQDVFAKRLLEAVDAVEELWVEQFVAATSDDNPLEKRRQQKALPPLPRMILGGCCRTQPTTIASLRQLVDKRIGQSDSAEAMTEEQQQRLARLLEMDRAFDANLDNLGNQLQDLAEISQQQAEYVGNQKKKLNQTDQLKDFLFFGKGS